MEKQHPVTRLFSLWHALLSHGRLVLLRLQGVSLGQYSRVQSATEVRLIYANGRHGSIQAGESLELCRGVILETWGGDIVIGKRVFIGPYTVIYGHGGVTIGDCTLVSMHCRILSSNHTVPPAGSDIRSLPDELLPTFIGRDVWLGAGVTVLGGVTIGDGCIVGAGAVVTKNLPPGSIAKGVPARITGQRPPQS